MSPIATKKMGVEMAAARAEIIPHAKIAASTSESAAMSTVYLPTFDRPPVLTLTGRVLESTMIRSDRLASVAGVIPHPDSARDAE